MVKIDCGKKTISSLRQGTKIEVSGEISEINTLISPKDNREVAFFIINDSVGSAEIICFQDVYQEYAKHCYKGNKVCVQGTSDFEKSSTIQLKVIAKSVKSATPK